jgi:hypothetical protein
VLIAAAPAGAQNNTTYFQVEFNKKELHINYTPFNEVQVLDNRFDTTSILIVENGTYPPQRINIEQPAAYAVKTYITTAMGNLQKGYKTLLLNITQMRVTNKRNINQRDGKHHINSGRDIRSYIMFSAEAYYKTGNRLYRKIVTIHKHYYNYPSANAVIAVILNNVLEAASNINDTALNSITDKPRKLKYLHEDSAFTYCRDTASVALEQINVQQHDKWAGYAITTDTPPANGIFKCFYDFRDDILTPGNVPMIYDTNDSTYFVMPGDSLIDNNRSPWAVSDSGNLYIRLDAKRYVKLTRANSSFYFYVPRSQPDMYAMLTLEDRTGRGGYSPMVNSGNIWVNLIGSLVIAGAEAGADAAKDKKIKREGMKNDFRNCYIDMDTGDIIYH